MDKVRCKFSCVNVETANNQSMIKLQAVTTGSEENDSFFKYTPWGNLEFGWIDEQKASQMFTVGKEYFIDIMKS